MTVREFRERVNVIYQLPTVFLIRVALDELIKEYRVATRTLEPKIRVNCKNCGKQVTAYANRNPSDLDCNCKKCGCQKAVTDHKRPVRRGCFKRPDKTFRYRRKIIRAFKQSDPLVENFDHTTIFVNHSNLPDVLKLSMFTNHWD